MLGRKTALFAATLLGVALAPLGAANAAQCYNEPGHFDEWRKQVKAELRGRFKPSTLAKLDRVQYSPTVIKLDRGQKSFKQSFETFYKRRTQGMVPAARKRLQRYASVFDRAEREYGVPRELIVAIWGLETAFGTFKGRPLPILQSVSTLCYDCRRSEFFCNEVVASLEVIDRGLADLEKARGAWAGEIGQTQFLASRFLQAAVDYDGGGVDVFNSPADVIGSTSRWFAVNGWRSGQDWSPGTHNFNVIKKWNSAGVYQKTIAKLAKEI